VTSPLEPDSRRTISKERGTTLLDFVALQRLLLKRPSMAGLPSPTGVHPGVSTPSANRAGMATFSACRICFAPATLLSFHLRGLKPSRDTALSPEPVLPCCFYVALRRRTQLRRITPPGNRAGLRKRSHSHAPMAFSPLRRSVSPPWSRLPNSSSRVLDVNGKPNLGNTAETAQPKSTHRTHSTPQSVTGRRAQLRFSHHE
jgi:hypothetical protein